MITPDTDHILDKIKKLLALSKNNSDVNEAAAAAAKAQALIERYNIRVALGDLGDLGEGDGPSPDKIQERILYKFPQRCTTWIVMLADAIGRVNRVKVWFNPGTGPSGRHRQGYLSAAGDEEAIGLTSEMLHWLIGEVTRLYEDDKPAGLDRGEGKRWANGFKNGAVETIGKRLRAAVEEARAAARAEGVGGGVGVGGGASGVGVGGEGFALARINTAIQRLDEFYVKMTEEVKKKHGLRATSRSLGGGDGFKKGKEAGYRAKLGSAGKLT